MTKDLVSEAKMDSDEETKVENILTFIDTKVSGVEVLTREVDVASFVAGYTQQIIKMKEFKDIYTIIRKRILHLSYLVHLVCKYENFDFVYEKYKENLESETVDWNDDIDVGINIDKNDDSVPYDDFYTADTIVPPIKSEDESIHINIKRGQNIGQKDSEHRDEERKPVLKRGPRGPYKKKKDKATVKIDAEVKEAISVCPFCGVRFSLNQLSRAGYGVKWHLSTYHCAQEESEEYKKFLKNLDDFNNSAPFMCDTCGRKGFSENFCKCKYESKYTSIQTCEICSRTFSNKSKLSQHMNIHEEEEMLCVECNKVFKNRYYLKLHNQSSHSGDGANCSECGKWFNTAVTLKNHVKRMHRRVNNHICNDCGRAFFAPGKLNAHIKIVHQNIKAYFCELCPYKASSIFNLNLHRKKMHQQEKNMTRLMLKEMVEKGQHPYYELKDLHLLEKDLGSEKKRGTVTAKIS